MSKTNFIVINGKKYNSTTGEMFDSHVSDAPASAVTPPVAKSIDGVARTSKSQRTTTKHNKKPVQKSTTLMRKSVKKPTDIKAAHHSSNQKNVAGITKSRLGVSASRAAHASQVQKSPHVQKYGTIDHRSSVRKSKIAELPVKHASPVSDTVAPHQSPSASTQHSAASAAQAVVDSALHNANSHHQGLHPDHEPKKKRFHHKIGVSRKVLRLAAGSMAAILLFGFFALQNVPNISMRVASARSGVNSTMPGYTPSGFAFSGPINYSEGIVTVSFKSNTDERQYSVTQQNSGWNSDALLNEFVVTSTQQYQTYLDGRGRTLYIYDKNNATWVQDGVWYKVEGDSRLTTDQLARLAASM